MDVHYKEAHPSLALPPVLQGLEREEKTCWHGSQGRGIQCHYSVAPGCVPTGYRECRARSVHVCNLLYASNSLNPSGLFSPVGCSVTEVFTLLVDGGCNTSTHFHPFSAILAHFYPVLLHILCYRWMLDDDDG